MSIQFQTAYVRNSSNYFFVPRQCYSFNIKISPDRGHVHPRKLIIAKLMYQICLKSELDIKLQPKVKNTFKHNLKHKNILTLPTFCSPNTTIFNCFSLQSSSESDISAPLVFEKNMYVRLSNRLLFHRGSCKRHYHMKHYSNSSKSKRHVTIAFEFLNAGL